MRTFEKTKKVKCAVTCDRVPIAAATGAVRFCRQSEYLGSYRASATKDACSVSSGIDFEGNQKGLNSGDGVA